MLRLPFLWLHRDEGTPCIVRRRESGERKSGRSRVSTGTHVEDQLGMLLQVTSRPALFDVKLRGNLQDRSTQPDANLQSHCKTHTYMGARTHTVHTLYTLCPRSVFQLGLTLWRSSVRSVVKESVRSQRLKRGKNEEQHSAERNYKDLSLLHHGSV